MTTLATMRSNLAIRLGFVGTGTGSLQQRDLLNGFLQDAQAFLFKQYNPVELKKEAEFPTAAGQRFYDWPTDLTVKKIKKIQVKLANEWRPMHRGIATCHDTVTEGGSRSFPYRYENGPQMEVWPVPDDVYTIQVEYFRNPDRFTQDGDHVSLDEDLVFLFALANAKAHYRQPDAEAYGAQMAATLRELKAEAHQGARYKRGAQAEPMARPVIVD